MQPNDLKQWRARLNLSQAAAGELLGVGTQTVYRWEAGTRRISAMAAKFMALQAELHSCPADECLSPEHIQQLEELQK